LPTPGRSSACWRRIASIPRGPASAYAFVTVIAGLVSLISWALGLIVGGIVALEVARAGRRRGVRLHYPLLVASAYSGPPTHLREHSEAENALGDALGCLYYGGLGYGVSEASVDGEDPRRVGRATGVTGVTLVRLPVQ